MSSIFFFFYQYLFEICPNELDTYARNNMSILSEGAFHNLTKHSTNLTHDLDLLLVFF